MTARYTKTENQMNRLIRMMVAASLAIAATTAAIAQNAISGEVRKIDEGAGKITLKHGAAKSLGMMSR